MKTCKAAPWTECKAPCPGLADPTYCTDVVEIITSDWADALSLNAAENED